MATEAAVGMSLKQCFVTALTDTSSTDDEGVGTLRFAQNGDVYRWVQNVDTTAITVGMVVSHDLTDTSTMFAAVDAGADADLSALAGVVMAASIATEYYGWIQVLGFNASALVSIASGAYSVPIAAGDYLKGVDGGLYAVADSNTQPLYCRNLQALEVVASATITTAVLPAAAKNVLINCL